MFKYINKDNCIKVILNKELYINSYHDGCTIYYNNTSEEGCLIPHRVDGPAIEWIDGSKEWYYNGVFYDYKGSCDEFSKYVKTLFLI